jgi:hypothetical protein
MWSSQLVFQKSVLRERLLQGLHAVTTKEEVTQWNKYIQCYVNLDDPLHFNKGAIDFYQQHINHIYDIKTALFPQIWLHNCSETAF